MLSAGVFRTCLESAGHPTELVETLDISNADKLQAFNLIVREHKSHEWREMPLAGKFGEDRRGLGWWIWLRLSGTGAPIAPTAVWPITC
jgi:hypothetical protein